MDPRHIDQMVGAWRKRMEPLDPALRAAQQNDAWHHTMLEMMRRFAHIWDMAMQTEDIPEHVRRRVLAIVLLGSPDGLESLAYKQTEQLYIDAVMRQPPAPIYFGPLTGKGD